MKSISIILSVYLIILSSLPCDDMAIISSSSHSKMSFGTDEDPAHHFEKDLCSPFCICNCCGKQMIINSSIIPYENSLVAKSVAIQQLFYKSIIAFNFYGSIWQPPKLK